VKVAKSQIEDPFDCLVPTTFSMEGAQDGTLGGLSFVAKDLFSIQGHTSSFGHPRWRSTHSPSESTARVVRDLLDAGAKMTGLAKMDQLAYSLIGDVGEGRPPLNSTDPSLYCGGSSSGSASAVAGGLADFALGTDTAGSIRVPAAVCGILGLRPTLGVVSPDGVIPLAPSFDVPGVLARDANVLSRVFAAVIDTPPEMPEVRRVLMAEDLFGDADVATGQTGAQVGAAIAALMSLSIETIDFRTLSDSDPGAVFARVQGREIWDLHGEWVEKNSQFLDDDVCTRLKQCKLLSLDSESNRLADLEIVKEYRRRFIDVIEPGTVVVTPVVPRHGPQRSWGRQEMSEFRSGCFRLTAPAGLAGAPQATWSTTTGNGRRLGVGLLTAPGGDHLLLSLLERLSGWSAEIGN